MLKIQDAKITQKSPSAHHHTTLSGYIFATKAYIGNRKECVKRQYLLRISSQYAELPPLTAEICWQVRGTAAHFNGFRVLACLLH